ncbi:MAG: T9SS type A sorting domain-containing protein, partial [Flavobacteriaceae bacterium]
GVDASPGGTGSIADALGDGGGNPVLEEFLAALQQDLYSFIPTMSSLAIENPNWYDAPNLNDSPFVNFYIPTENEPHVTVTAASAQFALDEIRQNLGVSENNLDLGISLIENPVKEVIGLRISSNSLFTNLTARIYALTGQEIVSQMWNQPQGNLFWKQSLASGLYLLTVSDGSAIKEFKLVVR